MENKNEKYKIFLFLCKRKRELRDVTIYIRRVGFAACLRVVFKPRSDSAIEALVHRQISTVPFFCPTVYMYELQATAQSLLNSIGGAKFVRPQGLLYHTPPPVLLFLQERDAVKVNGVS